MDAKGGGKRSWRVLPEPIGSMGAAARAAAAVLSLRSGFHLFDFETGEVQRIHETQPGELPRRAAQRRQGRSAGPFPSPARWIFEGARRGRQAVSARSRPDAFHQLDDGIICSNGPCWEPRRANLVFRRFPVDERSTPMTTTSRRAKCASRRAFRELRQSFAASPDGANRRRRGLCLERRKSIRGAWCAFDPVGGDRSHRRPARPIDDEPSPSAATTSTSPYVTSMARPMGRPISPRARGGLPVRRPMGSACAACPSRASPAE